MDLVQRPEVRPTHYIAYKFSVFWKQACDYLATFQRAPPSGFFQRSPAKSFLQTLQGMISVVRAAPKASHRADMRDSIRDCFTALLHPQTGETYRTCGIALFCELSDHLYDTDLESLPQSFESLVLNFGLTASVWPNAPRFSEEVDPEKRIQVEDSSSRPPLDIFLKQIGCLRTTARSWSTGGGSSIGFCFSLSTRKRHRSTSICSLSMRC
jgi:hypothetical protein